jgi:hypothetical protein
MIKQPSQIRSSTPFAPYDHTSAKNQLLRNEELYVNTVNGALRDEELLRKKNIQLKKLAKAYYILQQEKKSQDEYVLSLEADVVHLRETVEQQKLMLEQNNKKLAKAHEKLLQREEGYIEKLEEQVADLTIQKEKHFIPQLKQLQRQKTMLDKKNLMMRKQVQELRSDLGHVKVQMKKMIESNERETLMATTKELEASNADLYKEARDLRMKLGKKTEQCTKQLDIITRLEQENQSLTDAFEQKKIWNNQTQLYYGEKRELIEQMKREKGTLKRQLRRETKRSLKREVVVSKLIESNSKIRKAHEIERMKPVTVVDHVIDERFYNAVSSQINEITRELKIDPATHPNNIPHTMEQSAPSVSSISSLSSLDHQKYAGEELQQQQSDVKRMIKDLRHENKRQVEHFEYLTEEFNTPIIVDITNEITTTAE